MSVEKTLLQLRSEGWMVAVHNDYKQDGEVYTFYLLTHKRGIWAKGEGEDDETALANASLDAYARMRHLQILFGTGDTDYMLSGAE